jgi:hypothetical protein
MGFLETTLYLVLSLMVFYLVVNLLFLLLLSEYLWQALVLCLRQQLLLRFLVFLCRHLPAMDLIMEMLLYLPVPTLFILK